MYISIQPSLPEAITCSRRLQFRGGAVEGQHMRAEDSHVGVVQLPLLTTPGEVKPEPGSASAQYGVD